MPPGRREAGKGPPASQSLTVTPPEWWVELAGG